jgi:hypothetical protein
MPIARLGQLSKTTLKLFKTTLGDVYTQLDTIENEMEFPVVGK